MKNCWILPVIGAAAILASCAEKQISASVPPPDGFKITGSLKGIPDSTWVFIESAENSNTKLPIDSSLVIEGKFELEGKIEESTLLSVLRTKNNSDYKFFWLENTVISFNGEKGKFRAANVTGSATERKNNELNNFITPVVKAQDSLRALVGGKGLSETEKQKLALEVGKLDKEERRRYIDFVKSNPSSIVSAKVLDVYKSTWGKEKTEELFTAFSNENKNTKYGSSISNYLLLNKNPQIGDQFVDFTQNSLDGNQVHLSNYKGKVVLLEFWASWCGPCRIENPNLVKTYSQYKAKGFEVVGVSLDISGDNWKKAIEKDGLPWVHVTELNGDKNSAALIYGISGVPDNFLIDRNGVIIARNLRGQELNDRLQELLK
ncbi:AhpC/TSA family protein [Pontibacter harenae]|uniref:AhpC/TSA family protein n=1 Tax=Pontibacter harenae TaxID=2894083 RepID=UPI001E652FE4|nr:AhpC/TSA family protein [Pontibacter harenae]MCC9167884.1 AhpC/TSA family protein [Pontibacter harenae]